MLDEFLITLVGGIDGKEESLRISAMYEHRDPEPSAFLPRGIESRVVDRNQFAAFVSHSQSQILQQL